MKKRELLLILLCFILCGCSAEINIELDKNYVTENTTLFIDTTDPEILADYDIVFRKNMPIYYDIAVTEDDPDVQANNVKYYEYKKTDQNYGYDLNYKYKFAINDYNNSRLLRNSFKSAYIAKDSRDDSIEFYTDNGGIVLMERYPQINNVKVNIKTDLLVIETNADSINGNVYTWNFDRSNYKRNIYIKTSASKKSTSNGNPSNPDNKKENDDESEDGNKKGTVKPKGSENGTISKSTAVDPNQQEKTKKAWIMIPLAILGFMIVVFIINAASKVKNK